MDLGSVIGGMVWNKAKLCIISNVLFLKMPHQNNLLTGGVIIELFLLYCGPFLTSVAFFYPTYFSFHG